MQPKVVPGCINEPGISDNRVHAASFTLPLREGPPFEARLLPPDSPEAVAVTRELAVRPPVVPTQYLWIAAVNDVALKMHMIGFRLMVIVPHEIAIVGEGENVVHDQIAIRMTVVMQVQAAIPRVVHDIILHAYLGTSGVQIDPPATVALLSTLKARDVVDEVVVQDRPGGNAEGVDPSNIVKYAVAQVMDMVVGDLVVMCVGFSPSRPTPAKVNAHPAQAANLVVGNSIVTCAPPKKHPTACSEYVPTVVDEIVVDGITERE